MEFVKDLAGDLCDAEFARQFGPLIDRALNGERLVVESWGGAWLEVKQLTDTKASIFPVSTDGAFTYRGDTSRRGQCGVMVDRENYRHALGVVRRRAYRMAHAR